MSIQITDDKKLINLRLSRGNSIQQGTASFDGNKLVMKLNSNLNLTKSSYVALNSLSIPFSWRNISDQFKNNFFGYIFNSMYKTVNIPDGSHQFDDMNSFLQQQMFLNNHYLLDADGNPVYFIDLQLNPIYYTITLTCRVIPSTLPSGWSNPANIILSGTTPQLDIPLTNFGKIIGFEPSTYPSSSQTTDQFINSTFAPLISPISSVLLKCNLVYNFGFSQITNSLYDFTPSQNFGSQLEVKPTNLTWNPCIGNSVNTIEIEFVSQSNAIVELIDKNNIVVNLSLVI